jgi:hypothetical protein
MRLPFAAVHDSESGTFETWRRALAMSVDRTGLSNRRFDSQLTSTVAWQKVPAGATFARLKSPQTGFDASFGSRRRAITMIVVIATGRTRLQNSTK